nr:MAG TPA: hypothetical protein [Caudoviricetes sp.]
MVYMKTVTYSLSLSMRVAHLSKKIKFFRNNT